VEITTHVVLAAVAIGRHNKATWKLASQRK
jgi:hypothetical protein